MVVPSEREPGWEWLNGPLVWAVDEAHQATYLFPRDCPRILLWPVPTTSPDDLASWFGPRPWRTIAHVEWAWLERIRTAVLYRYELPVDGFEPLRDPWMQVCRRAVEPLVVERIDDLLGALADASVELRVMPSLTPLRDVWSTTLHASGIRLRNAQGWS